MNVLLEKDEYQIVPYDNLENENGQFLQSFMLKNAFICFNTKYRMLATDYNWTTCYLIKNGQRVL